MAKLMYRDPSAGLVAVDLLDGNPGPAGPQGVAPSPVGSISADAGNIATLLNNEVFVPAPADGGLPTGTVVAFAGSVAPAGWHPCDGTLHDSADLLALTGSPATPDLGDMFVRASGAMAPGATGGAKTVAISLANLPSHNHGGVSGPQSADHTHGGSSGTMNSNWAHGHGASSGTVSADHAHWVPDHGSQGHSNSHQHTVLLNDGNGSTGDGNFIDSNPNNSANQKVVGNTDITPYNHGHGEGGVWTGGHNANHTHIPTINAIDINHSHSTATGGASVGHTHAVTADGGGQPVSTVPGFVVLMYIVKK